MPSATSSGDPLPAVRFGSRPTSNAARHDLHRHEVKMLPAQVVRALGLASALLVAPKLFAQTDAGTPTSSNPGRAAAPNASSAPVAAPPPAPLPDAKPPPKSGSEHEPPPHLPEAAPADTRVPVGTKLRPTDPKAAPKTVKADPEIRRLRRQIRRALTDGAQDFGLTPALTKVAELDGIDEQAIVKRAEAGWVLAAELGRTEGKLSLRLIACPPGETILRVKHVALDAAQLQLTVVRFLRDVLRSPQPEDERANASETSNTDEDVTADPQPTDGRAYLAVTGALVGGYVGFAMEHIAGSSDARLTYPLMTLGAGIGVGASLIAAEEWYVSTPEAVYLSGTTLWSTAAALLMTDGSTVSGANRTSTRRHAYGLLGTASGLSLGTLAISVAEIDQGGALLVHSGAVYGGLFGVLTQRLIEAEIEERPTLGLGAGLGAGTLIAGVLATQLTGLPPERLVYVDLSAFLGGLTGAAVGTPVIVGDDVTETETRIWFGSILLGTLAGATLGYFITEPVTPTTSLRLRPTITQVEPAVQNAQPGWSLGLAGSW